MFKPIFFTFFILIMMDVQARNMIRVKALGASAKGQYVAFEEFGYLNDEKTPFVRVRIKNVWTNKYINNETNIPYSLENNSISLSQMRARALEISKPILKKYGINT